MEIRNPEDIRKLIMAGNSLFTLSNDATGGRFTFKVKAPHKEGAKDTEDIRFVSLLSGPDNTEDYQYLGCIFQGKDYRRTGKSRVSAEATSQKAFNWFWTRVNAGKELPEGVRFHHEGRCCRCGRTLTVPESIEMGIGPECAGKAGF